MRLVASITASSRLILRAGALVAATLAGGLLLNAENPQVPSGTWENTGSMSEARSGASAALLPDGRVLVTGGITASEVSTSAERYSLSAEIFLPTPPMSQARANHASTVLADGRVLVTGGTGADGRALASTELYDPDANVWVAAGSLSVARSSHTATLLPDGKVLVAGGEDSGVPNATLEVFDPATETFAAVDGALSAPRTAHAAARLADGRVLIIGGLGGANVLASVDVYDPMDATVGPGPSLGISRAGHSATVLLDGRVLVAGGAGVGGELDSAEIFDPATDVFGAAGSALLAPRQNHLAFLLPHNNAVLIVGGSSGGQTVADAELYVPWQGVNGTFVATGTPAVARAWAAGASLSVPASDTVRTGPADGLLLLAGGSASADGGSPMSGAELYGFATVKTDAADYAPGQKVTITGAGWQPLETVSLLLRESPVTHGDRTLTAVADASGRILDDRFRPEAHDVGVRFYLSATGSTSQAQTTFTDAAIPTTTTLESSPNPSAFGQLVTFTATVTGSVVTEGTITFKEGATVLAGPLALDAAGQASFTSSILSMGSHTITAEYSGSAGFFDASTGTVIQTVGRAATTTTVISAPTPSVFGQTVLFTATVAPIVPGLGSVTGTVTFKDGGTTFGSAPLNTSGQAFLATAALALGVDRAITAEYSGNAVFETSTGGITHTVTLAATSTTLTFSPNPSVFGQEVTLTAKVVPVVPGVRTLSFSDPKSVNAGAGATYSVATGDFNGDGVPDFATTSQSTGEVSIVLGDGTGGFGSPALFPLGTVASPASSPVHVLAVDLDADGILDLVTANQGSANISVLRGNDDGSGNGDGTFGAPMNVATGSLGLAKPSGIAVGDFNADGTLDLAIANAAVDPVTAGQNTVSIRLGTIAADGALGFTPAGNFNVGTTPVHIVTADFNQDGVLDLATANAGSNTVSIRVGTGTGTLGALTNFTMAGAGTSPRAVVVGDFNGDGKADFATANFGTPTAGGSVSFRLNTGGLPGVLSFGAASTVPLGTSPDASLIRPDFMVGGDSNGDGTLDFAVTDSNHGLVSILTGSGTGAFAFPMRFNSGVSGRRLAAADLNGDGTLDLAIPTLTSNVNVLLNTGTGPPTGTVQFKDGATLLGAAPLDGGVATLAAVSTLSAGSHTITAEYIGAGSYNASSGTSSQTVNKAPVTVTADDQTKLFGAPDPPLTYQITAGSLIVGDVFTGALAREPGEDPGSYTIHRGTLALTSNYDLTFVNGTLTIVTVAPVNLRLSLSAPAIVEHESVTLSGSFADPDDLNPHTVTISWGDGGPNTTLTLAVGVTVFAASHPYADDNPSGTASDIYNVTVVVTDSGGAAANAATPIGVNNAAPQIASIAGPSEPLSTKSKATLTANFTDAGTMDSHTCKFAWGDGQTSTVTAEGLGNGSCRATHMYAAAGFYTVGVEVRDDDTGSVTKNHQLIVYDPNGFVTGGGWIHSPPGAFPANPFLTGKANFGFVAKYKKGAKVPTGETEFQFKSGQGGGDDDDDDSDDDDDGSGSAGRFRLNFHSTSYDWLVVSGGTAIYQGSGRINGAGNYGFLVSVVDAKGQSPPIDRFRIKIWNKVTGAVIYDNEFLADDHAAATFRIAQGSIVVHK